MNSWNILNSKLSSKEMSDLSQEELHVLRKKQQRIRVLLACLAVLQFLQLTAVSTFFWFGTLGSGLHFFGYMLLAVAFAYTLTASIHDDGFESIAGHGDLCKKVLDACQVSRNAEEYRQAVTAQRSLCNADAWHMHQMASQDVCKTAHNVPV